MSIPPTALDGAFGLALMDFPANYRRRYEQSGAVVLHYIRLLLRREFISYKHPGCRPWSLNPVLNIRRSERQSHLSGHRSSHVIGYLFTFVFVFAFVFEFVFVFVFRLPSVFVTGHSSLASAQ